MDYIRDLTLQPYSYLNTKDTKFISTGFSSDDLTNDLMSRKLTFVTGQSEEGKSIIVHRIMLNAVNEGHRVLLIDGEYYQEELINELYLKIIGNNKQHYDSIKINKCYIKEPKKHILTMIEKWHKDKIYILSKNECDLKTFEQMFNTVVDAVEKYKIDLVVFDNMMALISSKQSERNAAQADFVKNIVLLDRTHNCHSVIVNHPRQQTDRGTELDIFDMSGTTDMANSGDNIFIVQRLFKPDDDEPDGYLHLKKNKLNGKHITMPLIYDMESRNYLEYVNGEQRQFKLNWLNEGKQEKLGEKCDDSPF